MNSVLALGALLFVLVFDGSTAIPDLPRGPNANSECRLYDQFGVLHHDCRLARVEATVAPTIMRLKYRLMTGADAQVIESERFGNFLVTVSLTKHQLFGELATLLNDPNNNLGSFSSEGKSCVPHVPLQDAFEFRDGQLRYEICKERLMCCDLAQQGANILNFLAHLFGSCATTCLLRISIKDYIPGPGDLDTKHQSTPENWLHLPLEQEFFDSPAIWDDPTPRCWSSGQNRDPNAPARIDYFCTDEDCFEECNGPLFDESTKTAISGFPPASNLESRCSLYDRFGVLHHDCRLVRLEAAFAPTILRLQNSLTTNAGSKVVTSAKFGNFLVSTSLARHEEFGKQAHVQPSNDPEKNLQKFVLEGTSCIPHVETQDAFLNGQLRYEICKERLMCCDVVPHGASTFLTELLPSCSTACLLTITVQNYSEFKGDKEAQLQSKSRTRVPLKERLNSLSVSDEPTPGWSAWSEGNTFDVSTDKGCSKECDGRQHCCEDDVYAEPSFWNLTEGFWNLTGRFWNFTEGFKKPLSKLAMASAEINGSAADVRTRQIPSRSVASGVSTLQDESTSDEKSSPSDGMDYWGPGDDYGEYYADYNYRYPAPDNDAVDYDGPDDIYPIPDFAEPDPGYEESDPNYEESDPDNEDPDPFANHVYSTQSFPAEDSAAEDSAPSHPSQDSLPSANNFTSSLSSSTTSVASPPSGDEFAIPSQSPLSNQTSSPDSYPAAKDSAPSHPSQASLPSANNSTSSLSGPATSSASPASGDGFPIPSQSPVSNQTSSPDLHPAAEASAVGDVAGSSAAFSFASSGLNSTSLQV